ncbi:hypothetical protein H6G89_14665 [Oscillatoria sp. FACHB-1407]|uniref:hypothetical protein n=1 Tax=Oscillatoria sp. FACHB-1407 TaxID=2692847 RepID=UPI001686A7A7|nr:hypothetical protein [Oscillatoria sp. FACHB-1407]MBD2462288.1 hypothetical protein [Oscillatoria sp. FACHB-1407]
MQGVGIIKNFEPLGKPSRHVVSQINKLHREATAAQRRAIIGFERDYWVVDASRLKTSKTLWLVTFERTVHYVVNNESKTVDVERFTVTLKPDGAIAEYRRMLRERVIG